MIRSGGFIITAILLIILACALGDHSDHVYTGVVEGTTVQIPALTGGRIQHISFDTGQHITKGDFLALIDTLELSFQRRNLTGMRQEIINQRQITATSMDRAHRELNYVKEKYQRYEVLLKSQSVPQQTVDDLANQLQNAESVYQTSRQQLQTTEARLIQAESQLQIINKKISDARIISPLSGVVTEKYFEEGEAVPPLSPIAEITHLDEVWVKIYISEKMLPHVKSGMEVTLQPDGTEQILNGKVGWINSKAEFTPKTILTRETRTSLVYAVKIFIANPEHVLKQGMPVEVHMKTQ